MSALINLFILIVTVTLTSCNESINIKGSAPHASTSEPSLSYAGATGTTGTVGSSMQVSPTILSNGGAAITSCVASPVLPSWATLDSHTCVINGTPNSELTSTTYTITAANHVGSSSATMTLAVVVLKRLAFQSFKTNRLRHVCFGPFLIALKDKTNLHFSPAASTISVGLNDDASSSSFHATPDCSDAPINSITILTGKSSATAFYYKTSETGTITITASDPLASVQPVSQTITVADRIPDTWIGYGDPAPSGRYGHSAIWTGSEMIVWGGDDWANLQNTGGRYNPATDTWGLMKSLAGAPIGRAHHSAIWTGSEMIVWGGMDSSSTILDTGGRYNPAINSWGTATSITGVPVARRDHSAIWTGSEMIIWGGVDSSAFSLNNGTRYDPSTDSWGSVTSLTGAPAPRSKHTGVWTGSEMIIWGGLDNSSSSLNTGARYNPSTDSWESVTSITGAPAARSGHTGIWTGLEMIIWGGVDNSATTLNTGGRYNPSTDSWGAVTSTMGAPVARYTHSAVWTGSEMIIWGGENDSIPLQNGGRYNPTTNSWGVAIAATQAPSPRSGHSAIWTGSEMIIWGGSGQYYTPLNSGGRYNPVTDSWGVATSLIGAPAARSDHSAVWTGSEMIIWGGEDSSYLNDGGRYNPAANTWGAISTINAPTARYRHSAIWTGAEMIIWGGHGVGSWQSTGGRYNPTTDLWGTATSTTGSPSPRDSHTAIWTGSEMIIWGGWNGMTSLDSGGRYDPAANNWGGAISTTEAPYARHFHSAIWTGSEMIIWGGFNNGTLSTGKRYNPTTNVWGAETSTAVESGRYGHSAIWTGNEMIVWGGWGITLHDDHYFYIP